jgi:hypothetical protein
MTVKSKVSTMYGNKLTLKYSYSFFINYSPEL